MEAPAGDPTDVTLATYERSVAAYCASSPQVVGPELAGLLGALAELIPGGHVLELGSGPGVDAEHLEQRGLTVDRTDGTLAFVERLQARGHRARLLDIRSGAYGGPYDAVVADAVLLHLGRQELERALLACYEATRPGGVLALTVKEGDGEAWTEAKLGAPRWFVYWRPQPLRDLLERTGWEVRRLDRVQGRLEPWLYVLASR